MQQELSIVIICKNEEATIARTLASVKALSHDIVVYDSGSSDKTLQLIHEAGITPIEGDWFGFGPTRRHATTLAKNDWILCVDADEWLEESLQQEIRQLTPTPGTLYRVRLKNHLGQKPINWGGWGTDWRLRLFNRTDTNWSEAQIHERVVLPSRCKVQSLQGRINHRTAKSIEDYKFKMSRYAVLTARNYFAQKKNATWLKRYASPFYAFFKNYILKLGFLDGAAGWQVSKQIAVYTFQKYQHLHDLYTAQNTG